MGIIHRIIIYVLILHYHYIVFFSFFAYSKHLCSKLLYLKFSGRTKLDLGPAGIITIVLAEDGTEIDEQDVLDAFGEKALMLLRDGEAWEAETVNIPGNYVICIIIIQLCNYYIYYYYVMNTIITCT